MKTEIPIKIRMDDGKMALRILKCGMNSLHTSIETKDKVIEIKTHPKSVSNGYLAPKAVYFELSSGLFGIFAQGPNVSCINKGGTMNLPKQMRRELPREFRAYRRGRYALRDHQIPCR